MYGRIKHWFKDDEYNFMADTGMFTILAPSNKKKIPGDGLILLYGQDFFCPEIFTPLLYEHYY